jgi:hypothetical protein
MMRGYGLYFTSRRVIGIKDRKAGGGFLLGAAVGAIGGLVAQKMSRDEALQRIHELDLAEPHRIQTVPEQQEDQTIQALTNSSSRRSATVSNAAATIPNLR